MNIGNHVCLKSICSACIAASRRTISSCIRLIGQWTESWNFKQLIKFTYNSLVTFCNICLDGWLLTLVLPRCEISLFERGVCILLMNNKIWRQTEHISNVNGGNFKYVYLKSSLFRITFIKVISCMLDVRVKWVLLQFGGTHSSQA